jgi:hypothetical protein
MPTLRMKKGKEEYRKKKAQSRAGQLFTEDDSQSKLF